MFKVVEKATVDWTPGPWKTFQLTGTDNMGNTVWESIQTPPFRTRIKISDDFKKLYAEELERARYYREVTEL